jgi:hypothetical protein
LATFGLKVGTGEKQYLYFMDTRTQRRYLQEIVTGGTLSPTLPPKEIYEEVEEWASRIMIETSQGIAPLNQCTFLPNDLFED